MATFFPDFLAGNVAKLLTYKFSLFFLKSLFFLNHSPCRQKKIFEKKTNKKGNGTKVAKLLTHSGQIIDPTAHIYIYAVELKAGPRFGVSSVKNWSKSSVKNWSKFFFHCFPPIFIVFFGYF